MLDPTYLRLTKDLDSPILGNQLVIKATATSETTLIDSGVFLRVSSTPAQDASLELLGGARYLELSNGIKFPQLPPQFSVSDNTSLLAPIVGARIKYDPNEKAHFWLRGDVGGFHVDDVALTWSGTVGFAYTIHPHIDLGAAYRTLGIDFNKGSISAANIVISGPTLGIAFYS